MPRRQTKARAGHASMHDEKLTRVALAIMAVGMIIGALLTL